MLIRPNELPETKRDLLKGFSRLGINEFDNFSSEYKHLPEDYIEFIDYYGFGKIKEQDEPENFPSHFELLLKPLSARTYYYADCLTDNNIVNENVVIFGLEGTGISYGFDITDDNKIVQIDNYRIINKLKLNFSEFIFGILACYPDFPENYDSGIWFNDINECYSMN